MLKTGEFIIKGFCAADNARYSVKFDGIRRIPRLATLRRLVGGAVEMKQIFNVFAMPNDKSFLFILHILYFDVCGKYVGYS